MTSSDNSVVTLLRIIAFITYIGAFVLGLVFGREARVSDSYLFREETVFSFTTALLYWSSGLISGTFILGFAELISLSQLQADIANSSNRAIIDLNSYQTSNDSTSAPEIKPGPSQSSIKSASGGNFDLDKWKNNNI